ncbi:hypothetical protein [Leptospira biflexa]|jgi:PBP1b-binding outer membrane lipoprotein LpoB|uniref:hypothetical protein n=1 Tax=Leptospira biflexa TaxID=172 RepID=UPI0002F7ED13|nr:hypothetical protein [Leptospira biflexa]
MKKISSMLIIAFLAVFMINCASEEVKQPTQPVVEEPKPSKKPKLDESFKTRARDIK